jgi:hypothetical protein
MLSELKRRIRVRYGLKIYVVPARASTRTDYFSHLWRSQEGT